MTVIYLTDYNTRSYAVTFQNNGYVTVQKFEVISNHEYNIYCIKHVEIFLGKSHICNVNISESGDLDKSVFVGKTILIKVSEENKKTNTCISVEIGYVLS